MYKTLGIAVVLLAAFAFTPGSRSADASPATPVSPPIVAKGKLRNQTAGIPTTTIFTPTQDGLYRLSVYATITTVASSGSDSWLYNFEWTDDAGPQSVTALLISLNNQSGQFLQLVNTGGQVLGGPVLLFQAKAGTPVTYGVNGAVDGSAYSLYYTLERLE